MCEFQSSPGPKAGRCRNPTYALPVPFAFQSSPGPKAGRCLRLHEGDAARHRVSILARPEGRALRRSRCRRPAFSRCFNPRPARRPGAAWQFTSKKSIGGKFQSSPGPKAGRCPDLAAQGHTGLLVSILARPEGRALPGSSTSRSPPRGCFNPRPARRPGAACGWTKETLPLTAFQSSPGPKAGRCRWCRRSSPARSTCFNPRPARRPGAAIGRGLWWWRRTPGFNPRPARRPGAARPHLRTMRPVGKFQSSPGPKAGRCRDIFNLADVLGQFQSSPGPKAGRCVPPLL